MITCIITEKEFYSRVSSQHLKKLKISIDDWIRLMQSDSVFGDELMLYALSRPYQRHTVVFTSLRCWSTIGSDNPISSTRLLEICQVPLLYIGQHMYGELKLHLFVPVMGPAIAEGLTNFIPPSDDDCESLEAMDLTKKSEEGNTAEDTTVGSDSESCIDNLEKSVPSLKINDIELEGLPDNIATDSDTPSESLLSPPVLSNGNLNNISGTNTTDMSISNKPLTLSNEYQNGSNGHAAPTSLPLIPDNVSISMSHDSSGTPNHHDSCNNIDSVIANSTQETQTSNEDTHSDLDMMGKNMESDSDCATTGMNTDTSQKSAMDKNTESEWAMTSMNTNTLQKSVMAKNDILTVTATKTPDSDNITYSHDTYKDGPLSGALEKIHMDMVEILCTLATLQLHEGATQPVVNGQAKTQEAVVH